MVGTTRWGAILNIILPAAISGIVGGIMLALGRAMGETMAVTMIIGNSNNFSFSLLAPGNTIYRCWPINLENQTVPRFHHYVCSIHPYYSNFSGKYTGTINGQTLKTKILNHGIPTSAK